MLFSMTHLYFWPASPEEKDCNALAYSCLWAVFVFAHCSPLSVNTSDLSYCL